MILRCPNKECNTRLFVKDDIAYNPGASIYCSSCKKLFKPFETLPENLRKRVLEKREETTDDTELLTNGYSDAPPARKPVSPSRLTDYDRPPVVEEPSALGWLVVHDEYTRTETYPLLPGKHLAGRASESKPCDLMIETEDRYMHRTHFYITAEYRGGQNCFIIEPHPASAKGNGTYIETGQNSRGEHLMRRLKEGEAFFLSDGDTIQAGRTKLVLKTRKTVSSAKDATDIISKTTHKKTILL